MPTPAFRDAADWIDGIIESGEGLYLFTGLSGTGKSAVLAYSRDRSTDRAVILLEKLRRVDGDNLAALLNEAFGVDAASDRGSRAQALRYFLKLGTLRAKGKRFILVVEDVEEIHSSGAELIGALLQMKAQDSALVTIILVGNQQLDTLLDRSYRWGIQKLIRDTHQLMPLKRDQAESLIAQIPALRGTTPVPFRRGAKRALVRLSGGVPGTLITLGHRAANIARRTGARAVSARMVQGAATGSYRSPWSVAGSLTSTAAIAAVVLLLIPVAIVQQDLSPIGFSEMPVGGIVSEVEPVPVTAQSVAATQSAPEPATTTELDVVPGLPPESATTASETDPDSPETPRVAQNPPPARINPSPSDEADEIGIAEAPAIIPTPEALTTPDKQALSEETAANSSPVASRLSPAFVLSIPAIAATSQATLFELKPAREIPPWPAIQRTWYASFTRQIPPSP